MHGNTNRYYVRTNNLTGYDKSLGLQKWNSFEATVIDGQSYGT